MTNNIATRIAPVLQTWVEEDSTRLPMTLAKMFTPIVPQLGNMKVIHPTDNDPVLVSDKFGAIAIWLDF